MRSKRSYGLWLLALLCAQVAGAQEPIVTTVRFSSTDAPKVTPTDHGQTGQNAQVNWSVVAAGPTAGHDALYFFTVKLRIDTAQPTPLMSALDLATGKLREVYPGDRIKVKMKGGGGLDLMDEGVVTTMNTAWSWGRPACGARGPKSTLYLGTRFEGSGSAHGRNALLAYDARENVFEELARLGAEPVAMTWQRRRLWLITADGKVYNYSTLDGLRPIGRLDAAPREMRGLFSDDKGFLYAAFGPPPYKLQALRVTSESVSARRLLPDLQIEQIDFHENVPAPWCRVAVLEKGHVMVQRWQLYDGKATRIEGRPDESRLVKQRGYELAVDWDLHPLRVGVRAPGGEWKHYPIRFERAAWDTIRTLRGGPRGRYLYGAGWPTAWVWRFDPRTGQFRMLGRHYNIYEMHTWRDEMWATAYYGIKFMRWHTEEPWTYDETRHWANKSIPMHGSPWGDKDTSNPRMVCRFRYLKRLFVRRSGGMVVTPDGKCYIGARTPAVEYWRSRYGGAVNWYDQATETIGQIRGPFLHHSVRDMCAAGPRHVAVAASQYISLYEPLPKDFSSGKFCLVDTRTQKVVLDISPLDAPLSYCEEGEPGRVVACGYPGRYGGEGIRAALFIFDVARMRVTHVVRLPFKVVWTEYDNLLRFERGPDKRIYFYGRDDKGVALLRIDSRTAKVEPVLRGHNLTDVAGYVNVGASFCFFQDRVYFGAKRLVSLPVKTVIGDAKQ